VVIAALEFDLETLFLDHPDTETYTTTRDTYIDAAVQGSIGRQLPRFFAHAGVINMVLTTRTILTGAGLFQILLGEPRRRAPR
jgi:hypothetical protein